MKKLFISQPMRGKEEIEILREREVSISKATEILGEEIEVVESFFEEVSISDPVWLLGRSIQFLSEADVVFFAKGWKEARGCKIEHLIAEEYGIQIIEAEE